MPERERPQERSQCRRGHHPVTENTFGRPGTEHVGVVDMRTTGGDRVHQCHDLPARTVAADASHEADRRVGQGLEIETGRHRGGQE